MAPVERSCPLPWPAEAAGAALAALHGPGGVVLPVRLEAGAGDVRVTSEAEVRLGPAEAAREGTRREVEVGPARGRRLRPRSAGHLWVEPDGAGRSRLRLEADLRVPLGRLGRALDHGTVARSLEALLDGMAADLHARLLADWDARGRRQGTS